MIESPSKHIPILIDEELLGKVDARAKKANLNRSAYIRLILRRWYKAQTGKTVIRTIPFHTKLSDAEWGFELWELMLTYCEYNDDCWEWQGEFRISNTPHWAKSKWRRLKYGLIQWNGKKLLAHRISWCLHNGHTLEIFDQSGNQINHICNNSICINPDHLYLGNKSTNAQDAALAGTINTQKLTAEDVWAIREMTDRGLKPRHIAPHFPQVGLKQIGVVGRRKQWAWLPEKEEGEV